MFISENFSYASTPNTDMGVYLMDTSGGEKTAQFGISRKVDLETVRGRAEPYFFGTIDEPLQFEITLCKNTDDEWTENEKIKLAKWLFPRTFQNFISNDNSGIVYKCLPTDKPSKILYGNMARMFNLQMICNAPYAHSTPVTHTITTSSTPVINSSNLIGRDYYPIIQFTSNGSNFSFINHTTGITMNLVNLSNNEVIYINGQKRQIISSLGTYHLADFDKNWLTLQDGVNNLQVLSGTTEVTLSLEFPLVV